MIHIKLSEILGKRKMTRKRLSELTGVRANTIGDIYNEKVKKIDIETLDRICTVLDCSLSDIIEHEKNNTGEQK